MYICAGVSSVAITGGDKDQLEVVGAGVDAASLVSRLRKKVLRRADILLVEEAKDKKKPEEPPQWWWPGYYYPQHRPPPMQVAVCEEPATASCHIM